MITLKKITKVLLLLVFNSVLHAQVGIGTTAPDSSAILDLESSNSGLLVPRLTQTEKQLISNPATGLLVYQTDNAFGFWYYNGNAWVPFTSSTDYTFDNGLTASNNNAQLGGDLVKHTTLDLDNYNLRIKSSSLSSYPGNFKIDGKDRSIFSTSINQNYAHFGNDFAFIDSVVDGSTLTSIVGDTYTIDIVAGFQSESEIGGSGIKLGSVEYFIDGISEVYLDADAGFHPRFDQTSNYGASLGSSSKRWASVYANDGVIQTSDMRFKTNVKPLKYGLDEILKLNTITYKWKEDEICKKGIADKDKATKIGLSAQELLKVIPEVVKTHSIVPSDEKGNYKRIENDKLGVNYSELIPVLINAIQEQQEQIKKLEKLIIDSNKN